MTSLTYQSAGVDISAGNDLVEQIKPFVKKTFRPEVIGGLGGFGGLFKISTEYKNPILVSATDGVGTKLKLAFQLNYHHTIGQDLVAMNVNDVLVQGAEPLFFLDYFACGKLVPQTAVTVIQGIALACQKAGCSLIGGETAEMPDMYPEGEYDLAGFVVGVVEQESLIDGSQIKENDIVIGLSSSGPHANGYSLIRKIISLIQPNFSDDFYGTPLQDVIMAPTQIYVKTLLPIRHLILGMAHITGGGLIENIPRSIPQHLSVEIYRERWGMPPIFAWLQSAGGISDFEMYRTFNCGIGMALIIRPEHLSAVTQQLVNAGQAYWEIGTVRSRQPDKTQVIIK